MYPKGLTQAPHRTYIGPIQASHSSSQDPKQLPHMIHKASQRPHKEPTYRPHRGLTHDPFKHQQAPQRPSTGLIHVSHKPYAGPTQVPHHIGLRQASHRPHQTSLHRSQSSPTQATHSIIQVSQKPHTGPTKALWRCLTQISHTGPKRPPTGSKQAPHISNIGHR